MEKIKVFSHKKNCSVELVKINGNELVRKQYKIPSHSMLVEINILATSQHANIIQMQKLILGESVDILIPKEEMLYGDMISDARFSTGKRYHYLSQIALGLQYLHHKNIIHFDLKPDNIMVTNDVCKIIDFGSAEYLFGNKFFTTTPKCTTTHRPPEGFFADDVFTFDRSFDIWSFGIIIYETLCKQLMYLNPKAPIFCQNEREYDIQFHSYIISENFSNEINSVVPVALARCLRINADERPNIDVIVTEFTGDTKKYSYSPNSVVSWNHKWIQYYVDLVQYLNKYYPNRHLFYPDSIIHATTSLIDRLSRISNDVNKKMVDHAIMLCYHLTNYHDIYPLAEIFPNFAKEYDQQMLNQILTLTNGVILE